MYHNTHVHFKKKMGVGKRSDPIDTLLLILVDFIETEVKGLANIHERVATDLLGELLEGVVVKIRH
jgi:hypothetical protein